jgi:chaperonin GroES
MRRLRANVMAIKRKPEQAEPSSDAPPEPSREEGPRPRPNPLQPRARVSRHVMPLGPRVLVRLIPSEDRSAAGLYLPPGAKDALARAALGEVVEVARASAEAEKDSFGANVSGVPHGSRVIFPKDKGLPVPWDEDLRILDVKDVAAIFEEIDLADAH